MEKAVNRKRQRNPVYFPPEENATEQRFEGVTNINEIMDRVLSGRLVPVTVLDPQAALIDDRMDFQQKLNIITKARQEFDLLPAKVKKRFNQDPGELVEFLKDEENRKEAESLGLVLKKKPVEPKEQTVKETKTEGNSAKAKPKEEGGEA